MSATPPHLHAKNQLDARRRKWGCHPNLGVTCYMLRLFRTLRILYSLTEDNSTFSLNSKIRDSCNFTVLLQLFGVSVSLVHSLRFNTTQAKTSYQYASTPISGIFLAIPAICIKPTFRNSLAFSRSSSLECAEKCLTSANRLVSAAFNCGCSLQVILCARCSKFSFHWRVKLSSSVAWLVTSESCAVQEELFSSC